MQFDHLHILGLVSFVSYFLFTFIILIPKTSRSVGRVVLAFGVISNALLLLNLFSTDLLLENDNLVLESHPALIVLLMSFVFYVMMFAQKIQYTLFAKVYALVSLCIFVFGSLLLHKAEATKVYTISPELLLHIILSLIAQVLLIVVFVLSVSLIIIHTYLKSNNSLSRFIQKGNENLPALMPTQEVWQKAMQYAAFFYCLSIVTGLGQLGGLKYSEKITFAGLHLLGLISAYLSFKFSKLSMFSLTLILSSYIAIVFFIQLLSRGELFKF